ncbi:MAG: hypothetical protein KDD25_02305 [Bdellovibrionales bacterium]|nr:hypothetical protein [Bdellovibrionales bacterium]
MIASGPKNIDVALGTVSYSRSTIELMFLGEPNEFNSGGSSIRFYRRKASGSSLSAPESLSFLIQRLRDGRVVGPFNELTRLVLTQNLAGEDIRNVQIVVDGLPIEYQLLRVEHRLESDSSTQSIDVLIPEFEVNPNAFAKRVPSVIRPFHPLWSVKNDYEKDSDFLSLLNQNHRYCE